MTDLRLVMIAMLAGCSGSPGGSAPPDGPDPTAPLAITSVTPTLGSVAGGTLVTLEGTGMSAATRVTIGEVACPNVAVESSTRMSCMTGSSDFREGVVDVVAERAADRAVLPAAFTYQCVWTTSGGRRSCGAAPAGQVAPQPIASWVTQFQDQHGFVVATPGASNLAETSDFVVGTQSVWFDTDGAATVGTLQHTDLAPIDFSGNVLKIWVKVDNVAHLAALDVWLGDARFANVYKFRLRSTQGQQWTTDGDWVAFTVSWSPENYVISGAPNRAAITDVMIRAADDGTGSPVRVHLNGLALVPEPIGRFPNGVVSYTFDDDWATQLDGFAILAAHGFPATAYVIIDTVGLNGRLTLGQLHDLQTAGWDIAAHANTDLHHFARYTTLTTPIVEDDIVDARAWLIANGFNGYDHCAYPGGDFTGGTGADVLGVAGRYFTSCRTVFEKQREAYPPADARKLRVLLVTGPMTLDTVEQAVTNARQNREWLILVFHQLVPGLPATTTEWASADFATLADYVEAAGIPVQPVTAVLAP